MQVYKKIFVGVAKKLKYKKGGHHSKKVVKNFSTIYITPRLPVVLKRMTSSSFHKLLARVLLLIFTRSFHNFKLYNLKTAFIDFKHLIKND